MLVLRATLLSVLLLLTGCVSQYSITQQEMTNYLNNEMHLEIKQGNRLLGLEVRVDEVDVVLGDKPETIAITAHSKIQVHNPIRPIAAILITRFEAKPWYDSSSHSIYLKQLQLTRVESTPKDIEKAIKPVAPQVMRFLTQYLETQPVYVLDTKESDQALLAEMTQRIEVAPGKLKLIFK
ncbi:DUF1439 domain-containing protein [Shewanella sp. AS1]|uniref:DUF1439 domain-containing protein n=1 Tax=Shewanella sp. AS1 TaxID=2907626 RepID=UPI001F49215F|nr:DUF1439 domain-containing protein [Shewanella sp. AS1]MCE9680208.1 DUF1439 domain-containing protein [Shewanella sp. AS1]